MQTGNFRGFEVTVQDPGIVIITFNQPERLNGMTHHLKRDLVETLIQVLPISQATGDRLPPNKAMKLTGHSAGQLC